MRVLIINSDSESAEKTKDEMNDHYLVDIAYSGEEGLYLSQVNDYSAVVIESFISDIPGSEICRQTRQINNEVPILMLTDKTDTAYKVSSLDCGADVILTKPVNKEELCAYLRTIIKRVTSVKRDNVVKINDVVVDLNKMEVCKKRRKLNLRRKEYRILEYLLLNRGHIVSKEKLLENVWEEGLEVNSNTLEVHIKSLRSKLESRKFETKLIKTVHGFGYKIDQ